MAGRGGRRGVGLLAASTLLYGVLLLAYPRAFRRRYAPEMRQAFADL